MAYILDAVVILVFLFCIWNGWRKGFIKALSHLVAFVLALAVALLVSGPIAGGVYDGAVSPAVQEALTDSLSEGSSATVAQNVDEALAAMPGFVRNLLGNQGISSGADVVGKLNIGNTDSMATVAQQIDENVIRPVAVALLRVLAFLVLFIVVDIAASFLFKALDKVFKLPLLRGLNRTLGVVPGILNGVLWVLLLTTLAQAWAAMGPADGVITQTTLADTAVLQWLVSINPLGRTLQDLMTIVV